MKKRGLSLFMVLVLCLTLLPTAAFAEGEDVSISGGVIGGGETSGEGGGIYVAPGSPTEGGGGTYIPGENTRTEIRFVTKPYSIERSYDGTTDGSMVSFGTPEFTDGTNTFELTEGTDFTAKKTFDSADAGNHTVTVEITLIGNAATKYKLKSGEEKFEIRGAINKAYPELTVSLSQTTCTVGEKILPLLSVSGVQENAAVTYYYAPMNSGYLEFEGNEAVPVINENTAISEPGTYYVYAKSSATKNYDEERSETVELTVTEPAAASVTKADGTVSGTYKTLPAALNAAQDGDTVKLLANHTTNWSDVEGGEYATLAVVKKTLTLDLNGMTVDYLTVGEVVPDEAGGILDSYDGNLTVVDNIQGGSCGKIKDLEFVKGSLAIQGGRIGDDDGSNLTCDGNSGSVIISGGTVYNATVGDGATVTVTGGTVCNATVRDGATVTVTGGTGHAGNWYNDGTLNITDGTFGNVNFRNNGGTIAISGGTFGTITNTNGSSSSPLMPLLADNYAFYQGDNAQNSTEKTLTNVTVRPHTHSFENGKCDCGVAAIVVDNNNSCYNTLQAALGAAADNASITSVTLGQDLTEDITFSGSAAGSLTLNMNGHKLETEAGVPLTVTGGTLRIEGAGEINQNTASNATAFPAISLTGGKLVIAGDLTAQGGYDSSNGRKPAIYATDGELDLQGNVSLNGGLTMLDNAKLTNLLTKGTFYAQDPNGNATADNVLAVCVQQEGVASDNYNTVLKLIADGYAIYKADGTVRNAAAFTLKSDTYSIGAHTCNYTQDEAHSMAYCNCGRSHAHRDLSEEKSVLVNGICPICGYHCPHKNIGNDGVCTDCNAKMVAKVTVGETTTYTADLADALNKAANGTTVTLLANIEWGVTPQDRATITGDGKIVTLNLNGHTITGGWLDIGSNDNPTSCTLKIIGEGSHESLGGTGGYSGVFPEATLNLSKWEGGTISSINISDNSNYEAATREAAVIVGPQAGTIGKLSFGNNQLDELKKTKLSGGSFNEIEVADFGPVKLGELLADGYAFQNGDGSYVEYGTTLRGASIYNVKVVKCLHPDMKPGEDGVATCEYCGKSGNFVASVDGNLYTNMDEAITYWLANGGTLKLYADYTATDGGTWRIGSGLHTINLNGHKMSVQGDGAFKPTNNMHLTVTDGKEIGQIENILLDGSQDGSFTLESGYVGNLEMTGGAVVALKGGSVDKVDVQNCSANTNLSIQGGSIGQLNIKNWAEGMHVSATGGSLGAYNLPSGKILADVLDHQYYAEGTSLDRQVDTAQPVEKFVIKQAPYDFGSTSKAADVPINGSIPFTVDSPSENVGVYEVKWYRRTTSGAEHMTENKVAGVEVGDTLDVFCVITGLDRPNNGTVLWQVAVKGYTLQTLPPSLENAEIRFADGGQERTFWPDPDNHSVGKTEILSSLGHYTVTLNGKKLTEDRDYRVISGNVATGIGTYDLTIEGIAPNYSGTKTAQWRVVPFSLGTYKISPNKKQYDGTVALPDGVFPGHFDSRSPYLPDITLREGTDYVVTDARFDTPDASNENKPYRYTVELKNPNYVFANGTKVQTWVYGVDVTSTIEITKADAPAAREGALEVINNHADTYTVDLSALLPKLESPKEYGAVTYALGANMLESAYYAVGTAKIENGRLILPIQAVETKETGSIGSVKVKVSTTNYHDFTLTINVNAANKIVPTGGGGGSSSDRDNSGSTGKTETTTKPDGTTVKTETRADGTKIQTVTNKDGSTVKTETKKDGSSVTENKAADGSTGTVKTDKNGQTTAETKVSAKAVEDAKKNGEPVKAPVEVKATRDSDTAPTVKIDLPRNSGDTKVEIPVSNVKPGTVAVLVHPDGTEEIVKNSLPTADGIQLTVNGGATVKIVDNSKDFADTRNHWAKDAIDFVSARGLVNGMSATIYAPNNSTTRAQLWTILARQADADLTGGATWFENAQNWAKAKGISDGANPNAAINRAQMVTMLWRAVGQPVAGSTANFADVSADAYYTSAVAWAVENGITTGVGNGKFDPNAACTRGQIATFLWRAMAE